MGNTKRPTRPKYDRKWRKMGGLLCSTVSVINGWADRMMHCKMGDCCSFPVPVGMSELWKQCSSNIYKSMIFIWVLLYYISYIDQKRLPDVWRTCKMVCYSEHLPRFYWQLAKSRTSWVLGALSLSRWQCCSSTVQYHDDDMTRKYMRKYSGGHINHKVHVVHTPGL